MAARNLTAGMLSAIAAGTVYPAILIEMEFLAAGSPTDTEYLRLWSGAGVKVWSGRTFTGAGGLLSISPITESRQVQAIGFTASLTGIRLTDLERVLSRARQGRTCTVWLACMDASGSIIADPYQLQKGKMDYPVIDDAGEVCTISAQFESRLVDLEKPRNRRYAHEDQQIDATGDLGFEFVPTLQDKQILWG